MCSYHLVDAEDWLRWTEVKQRLASPRLVPALLTRRSSFASLPSRRLPKTDELGLVAHKARGEQNIRWR